MDAQEKLACQRLSLLRLAEELGNVSEACRRRGVSRTQFYEHKRRFEARGLEGLKDLPPIHKSHPLTTPPEVEEHIIALSREHPSWGCTRLSNRLKLEGISISSPTVQRILIKHGLGTRRDRRLRLKERQGTERVFPMPSCDAERNQERGAMDAQEKLACQRLSLLRLAEELGNVSEACRRRGVSRTQFYEHKRRFEARGLEGLKDLPPIHKSHPLTTPPEVEEHIIALSREHPSWGCTRLSNRLKLEGISISSPTVQRILIKHGLGTRRDRRLRLKERQATEPVELTEEQAAFLGN